MDRRPIRPRDPINGKGNARRGSDKPCQLIQLNTVLANAIIRLDMFAKTVPMVIEEAMDEIRYLFVPYLDEI